MSHAKAPHKRRILAQNKMNWKSKPIIPEVCDRLGCKLEGCYGWDLCRQARAICTKEEWDKLLNTMFPDEVKE